MIDLSRVANRGYNPGRPKWFIALWYFVDLLLVRNPFIVFSGFKAFILRLFGAKIGRNVLLHPGVQVKFPWNLEIGDNCWIGERVWIHNQGRVVIGSNTVISQESFISTGSHDTLKTMDLVIRPVIVGDGVWLTTRCIVKPGVTIGHKTIVTPASVVHKSLPENGIFGGNPVQLIKQRFPDPETVDDSLPDQ